MTNEQKAQFLDLAAQNLDLLKGLYSDLQWRYWGRLLTSSFVLPQAALDALSGVPTSVKTSLRQAGLAMQTLTEMAPQVPQGGAPHGTPENWVAVWVDLADSTEQLLRLAAQTLTRTGAFDTMMEMWRGFAKAIGAGLKAGGKAAESLGAGAVVLGLVLLVREFRRK